MESKTKKKTIILRKKGTQKETDKPTWTPNAKQIKMMELFFDTDDTRTDTAKMAEIGVSRKTYYAWLKDGRFLGYMNSLLDEYLGGEMPSIMVALAKKAKSGDLAAIRLVSDIRGSLAPVKMQIDQTTGGQPLPAPQVLVIPSNGRDDYK